MWWWDFTKLRPQASSMSRCLPVLDKKLGVLVNHVQNVAAASGLRHSVVMRMEFAAKAMQEVAGTVDGVSKKLAGLSAPDLGGLYRQVSDEACRICGMRMFCWEQHYADTMNAFNDMTPLLREKGRISPSEVKGHLARNCSRLDEVTRLVNAGYREHLVREGAWRRLSEIRAVVTDQFSGMADMLGELAADFANRGPAECRRCRRVSGVCEAHGLSVRDVACSVGQEGRMTVDILASDKGSRVHEKRWKADVEEACGREFAHPVVARMGDVVRITLTERPLYRVTMGSAQLCCTGEKLCGDAFETFQDNKGCRITVLSDGMGSGGRAAVDGARAGGPDHPSAPGGICPGQRAANGQHRPDGQIGRREPRHFGCRVDRPFHRTPGMFQGRSGGFPAAQQGPGLPGGPVLPAGGDPAGYCV